MRRFNSIFENGDLLDDHIWLVFILVRFRADAKFYFFFGRQNHTLWNVDYEVLILEQHVLYDIHFADLARCRSVFRILIEHP